MVKSFINPQEARHFYDKQRSALARHYDGKWLVFVPASAAMGHPSTRALAGR